MPTEEEEEAPSITEFHSSTHVLPVGQTARYTCHAGGTPEPTVEWLHNGRPLERDGTDDQSEAWVERGFLFIRGGRYGVNTVCCMASNSAGTANHSAELLVFGKSWIQGETFVDVFILFLIDHLCPCLFTLCYISITVCSLFIVIVLMYAPYSPSQIPGWCKTLLGN